MRPRLMSTLAVLLCASAFSPRVGAQSIGLDFVTIGDPGNRPTRPDEVPLRPDLRVGGVAHTYRLTRTEITSTQWLEFVNAYAPYWDGSPDDSNFTSFWIYRDSGGYAIAPGYEKSPVDVSWRMAARYCNWLHNHQADAEWAFENGAYDTSTFTENPDGTFNDQEFHTPGARFWIPTWDEWAKAAYYDPHRYGEGEEGYWLYPASLDRELISALPEDGGETNAGPWFEYDALAMDAGSYPWASGPWGLLDISGGAREWTEGYFAGGGDRRLLGSAFRSSDYTVYDRLDIDGVSRSPEFAYGFRVATIPEPAPSVLFLVLLSQVCRRRK